MRRKTVANKKKLPAKKTPIKGDRSVKDYFPPKPTNSTINDAVEQSSSPKPEHTPVHVHRQSRRTKAQVTDQATPDLPPDQVTPDLPPGDKDDTPPKPSTSPAEPVTRRRSPRTRARVHEEAPSDSPHSKNKRKAANTSKGLSEPVKKRKRCDKYKPLITRMSPSQITSFINSDPSEEQIEAIKSLGFGGLLQLQSEELNGHLARWIVETFNPFDCSLMDHKMVISEEDVHVATGLPIGPLDVHPAGMFCQETEYTEAVNRFKAQFRTSDIKKKDLLAKIMEQRDGGDDFKRNFLVYIVNVLLMGVVGDHPSPRILRSLSNLSVVPQMNWCKFALSNMIDSVISWKKAVAKSPKAVFKGPILIFQIIYLDRAVFMTRTVSRSFPLLANWTDEKIQERVKLEKHKGGGFGKGFVDAMFVYVAPEPEAQHQAQPQPEHEPHPHPHAEAEPDLEAEPVDPRRECIKVLAGTAIRLADLYGEFSKAVQNAKCQAPGFPAVSQMSNLADCLFEGFSLSQQSREEGEREGEREVVEGEREGAPDSGEDLGVHANPEQVQQEDKIEEAAVEQDNKKDQCQMNDRNEEKMEEAEAEQENKTDQCQMSDRNEERPVEEELKNDDGKMEEELKKKEFNTVLADDAFLGDPTVLAELEGLLNDAYTHVGKVFDSHQEALLKEKKRNEKALMEGPSFSLFSGDDDDAPYTSQEFRESRLQAGLRVPHASTSTMPPVPVVRPSSPISPILISSQLSQPSPVVISSQVSLDSPISPLVSESPTAPSDYVMETRQAKRQVAGKRCRDLPAETLQTKRVFRKRCVEVADVYRSPFFIRNVDIVRDLSQSERLVGDYAFSEDLDEEEVLFSHAGKTLRRLHMKSLLLGRQVHTDVISVWCDYLNELNKMRARNSTCRLFLTDTTDIAALDLNFADVQLVLVPIVTSLPFLFCYYVDKNMLDVMHLMPPSADYSPHVRPVKNLLLAVASKIPKLAAAWLLIPKLYLPHADIDVERDTGIYLMRHMEVYNGVKQRFSSKVGLKQRADVKRYIARVCNDILTWKHNSYKDKVMAAAKVYKNGSQICNEVPEVQYTDAHLINYIRENSANKDEVVIATDWLEVTQHAMQTLLPENWLMDMVIDLVCIRTTLGNPSVVCFPTIIKVIVAKNGFRSQYILLDYLHLNLNSIKLAFFPYCVGRSHWFACVVDFGKKKNFILDSNLPRRPDIRRKFLVAELLPALKIIARDSPSFSRLLEIKNFQWEFVNVPQQKNGYSCGVYLLKWLENLCDQTSWTDERSYEDLDKYATNMIARLIKWERNKRKDYH